MSFPVFFWTRVRGKIIIWNGWFRCGSRTGWLTNHVSDRTVGWGLINDVGFMACSCQRLETQQQPVILKRLRMPKRWVIIEGPSAIQWGLLADSPWALHWPWVGQSLLWLGRGKSLVLSTGYKILAGFCGQGWPFGGWGLLLPEEYSGPPAIKQCCGLGSNRQTLLHDFFPRSFSDIALRLSQWKSCARD